MSFYAVIICCSSRRVACYAEVKYHIVKIPTYIPRGLSVFFYTPLWSVAHRIFQSPSGSLCCVLARHPQDWLSLMVFPERSGGTIIQQCSMLCGTDVFWKYFDFVIMLFLAVITLLCHMTVFPCRISGIFLSELWHYLSQRQMGFLRSLSLAWQSQISDP